MENLQNKKIRRILWGIIILIVVSITYHQAMGIFGGIMQKKAMSIPQKVQVMNPEISEIYTKTQVTGRIEAKYSVDVVARISGWLQKSYFNEGDNVKKNQALFLIEPDQYQIAVNNASANVRQCQAALVNAEKELVRAAELVKRDYVSKSYYDQALSTRDKCQAALDSAKAQLADAKLNLSYTQIKSPVDGKIGKIIITEGNLVGASSGALAKVVSVSPIYAYFNMKSSEFLKFRKIDSSHDFSSMNVQIQLSDGSLYKENGKIEFVDNEIDETTGTISLRATFNNADGLLVPGDFINVVVTANSPKKVMLVPQASTLSDAHGYYVWCVLADNKTVRKDIIVSDEVDKKWIVESGLEPDDIVVAKGIQSIKMQGQVVQTEEYTNDENAEDLSGTN